MSNRNISFVTEEEIAEFAAAPMEEIEAIWDKLVADHKEHLAAYGVKMPERLLIAASGLPVKKALQLIILRKYMNRAVHKNQVSRFIARWYPGQGDTQVRHLSTQDGWYVLGKGDAFHGGVKVPDGWHILLSTQTPQSGWQQRRAGLVGATDWEDLLDRYEHRCATCGAREKERHHHYPEQRTHLQKGHKDPHGPDSIENTIPQCQFCNRVYRDKVVFDERGRVVALANPDLVLASSDDVIRLIMQALAEKAVRHK